MTEAIMVILIKSAGLILAAAMPSIAALMISKSRKKREVLERDLKIALSDLSFMLAVEKEHGRVLQEFTGQSQFRIVRNTIRAQGYLDWSGKFTQHRIAKKIEELK